MSDYPARAGGFETFSMPANEFSVHHTSFCRDECGGVTEFRADLQTGRAHVTYPVTCPHKDECARRIAQRAGYGWRDQP